MRTAPLRMALLGAACVTLFLATSGGPAAFFVGVFAFGALLLAVVLIPARPIRFFPRAAAVAGGGLIIAAFGLALRAWIENGPRYAWEVLRLTTTGGGEAQWRDGASIQNLGIPLSGSIAFYATLAIAAALLAFALLAPDRPMSKPA